MIRDLSILSASLLVLSFVTMPLSAHAVPAAYPPGEHAIEGRVLRCVVHEVGDVTVVELAPFNGVIDGEQADHASVTFAFESLDSFSCGTHPLHPLRVTASGSGAGVGA